MLYLVAKTRRQALAWCEQNEQDPSKVRFVEAAADVRGFDPSVDTQVFLGTSINLDGAQRREIVETLGVAPARTARP